MSQKYYMKMVRGYAWRIRDGLKPACEIWYNKNQLDNVIKCANNMD
jgi:hypothetical protein